MKTINKLWFDNERIYIETVNGGIQSQPLRFFPRLRQATAVQRLEWTASHFGLHWKEIDEDISFESFTWDDNDPATLYFGGYGDNTKEKYDEPDMTPKEFDAMMEAAKAEAMAAGTW